MDLIPEIPPNEKNYYSREKFTVKNPFTGVLENRYAENNSEGRVKGGPCYTYPVIFIGDATFAARFVPCYDPKNESEELVFIRYCDFIRGQSKGGNSVTYQGRHYRRLLDEHLNYFKVGPPGPPSNMSVFEKDYYLVASTRKKPIVERALQEAWKIAEKNISKDNVIGLSRAEFRKIYENVKADHFGLRSDPKATHKKSELYKYGHSFGDITEEQYSLLMQDTAKAEAEIDREKRVEDVKEKHVKVTASTETESSSLPESLESTSTTTSLPAYTSTTTSLTPYMPTPRPSWFLSVPWN